MINIACMNVFLSGPMTGIEGWNRAAFEEAERAMRDMGAAHVFNPARTSVGVEDDYPHSFFMRRTLHALTHRDAGGWPAYDLLVRLPGWEASDGAQVEVAVAKACGIAVCDLSEVER